MRKQKILKSLISVAMALLIAIHTGMPVYAYQLFFETSTGQSATLEVEPGDSIDNVKAKIQDSTGIAPNNQRLFYNGQELENGHTLADYGISKNMTITVYVESIGQDQLSAPMFLPTGGIYTDSQDVTILCDNGATVYYTLDGTEPTTGSLVYSTPISVTETETIKAIAVREGKTDSSVTSATYTIDPTAYVNVSGNVTWIDNNNSGNTRPEKVLVNLYRDGEWNQMKYTYASDSWNFEFSDLRSRDDLGHDYTYTIAVGAVSGYTTQVEATDDYSFLIKCTDSSIPITYTVTVTNGTGSGEYAEGDNISIAANDPEEGKQFKEWTGTEGLTFTEGSATTASATFTMPAEAVSVTATYEPITSGTNSNAKTLPYTYGFENNDLAAEGWTRVDCLDNSKIYGSVASHSGSRGFGFYQTSSAQYLISPEIDSDGKDYSVSFYYKHLNDANSFQVGYSTTTSDLSAFTWANVTPIEGDWQLYKLDYSADVKYIALKGIITSNAFLLDDFSFVVSGCLPPTDLAASGITDQAVTLTWTAPSTTSTITGYTYQIKKQGDSWGTDTEVMDSSFTSVTFDNLSENTYYYFRVNTLYAEGESPDYETISFITDASGSVSLPFSEDFENGMGAWRVVNGDANTKIYIPYGKSNAFSFWGYAPQYLISPQIDCSAEITVSLKYCISDANMPKVFQVGYSTTTKDISAFTWGTEITGTVWDYEEYTSTFPAATKYIAIKYCSNSTKYLHIDDINVVVDGALPPTGLTASTIACQSTTITWNTAAEATGYAYQYKKVSDSTWSTESSTTSTSVTISGLMSDTDYDFRLKAIYGSNESIYTGARFTTATALPYEMNFEDGYGRWTMVDCTNSFDDTVNDSWRTGRRTQAAHDSDVGFQFHENYDSSEPQYLISPRFAGDTAVTLSFYYRVPTNIEATIYVGYSTTTNDKDAFTFGDAISFDSSSWVKYENTFPADACYFAIKYTSNEYLAYIDDICFEKSSTYAKPTTIGCTALSETEATIGWNVPEGVTGFIYQYKKATDSVWSAEASLNTNRATLSGLTPNTYYNFRVKAVYGSNDSTYATYNFQTYANVVDLPYSEGFENGMGGWRMMDCDGQSAIRKNSDPHNGSYCFAFGDSNQNQFLISPHFAGGVPIKVSFYYRNHENYQGAFAVGYTTGIDAGITWIDNSVIADGGTWSLYETTLPNTAQYCVICCREEGKIILLDDFCFEELTEKDASFVVTAPTANFLTYNASAQELVNAGVADGGTMVYSLEENGTYSEDIPTGTDADTYMIWYYVQGDSTHYDTEKHSVSVTISRADINPTVSLTSWTFGDNPNLPSVSGNPGNGTVTYQYKVAGAADNTYTDIVPTDVGAYTVRATIAATQNYKLGTATANFTISKPQNPTALANLTRSISKTNTSINISVATLMPTDAGTVNAYTINGAINTTGSVSIANASIYSSGIVTAELSNSQPGDTITIPVKIAAKNYDCTLNIVISINNLSDPVYVAPQAKALTYNGSAQALVNSGSVTTGGELQFSTTGNNWSTSVPTGTNADDYTVYYRILATGEVNGHE